MRTRLDLSVHSPLQRAPLLPAAEPAHESNVSLLPRSRSGARRRVVSFRDRNEQPPRMSLAPLAGGSRRYLPIWNAPASAIRRSPLSRPDRDLGASRLQSSDVALSQDHLSHCRPIRPFQPGSLGDVCPCCRCEALSSPIPTPFLRRIDRFPYKSDRSGSSFAPPMHRRSINLKRGWDRILVEFTGSDARWRRRGWDESCLSTRPQPRHSPVGRASPDRAGIGERVGRG